MFNLQNFLIFFSCSFITCTVATACWDCAKRWCQKSLNLKMLVVLIVKLHHMQSLASCQVFLHSQCFQYCCLTLRPLTVLILARFLCLCKLQAIFLPWDLLDRYKLFLLRLRQALGSKTLKSKNACCPLSQTPGTKSWFRSSLASFVVFAVLLSNSSLFKGVNFGLISMFLQTSGKIFALRSLRSLRLVNTKPNSYNS